MHSFFTPWKRQKTIKFSDVFSGHRKGALGTNGLMETSLKRLNKIYIKNLGLDNYYSKGSLWFFKEDFFVAICLE